MGLPESPRTEPTPSRAARPPGDCYIALLVDMYGGGRLAAGPPEAAPLADAALRDVAERRLRIAAALTALNREWRADITPVPYRGGGPIALAVAANEIQLGNMGLGNFIGGIQAGRIRPLAVATSARSPLPPEVPTFQEAGIGGLPSRGWWGLAAPRGLPRPVVDRANPAFATLFREPRFVAFLQQQAVQPEVASPEAFQAFLQQDRRGAEALVAIAGQPPAR
jgi:tripartite-type tricarboxylate transporter receptor subunit TctC